MRGQGAVRQRGMVRQGDDAGEAMLEEVGQGNKAGWVRQGDVWIIPILS